MTDILTWTHIGVIVGLASLTVTIWKMRRDDWKEIDRKIEAQSIALAAFKLQVAELHPTAVELAAIEARLVASLDRLSDRIDRMLERR